MDSKQTYPSDLKDGHQTTDKVLNIDQYLCRRCGNTIQLDEKNEHDDWHFAKDLEEQDGAASTEPSAQTVPPPHALPPQVSK
jgi:hypothetical protein